MPVTKLYSIVTNDEYEFPVVCDIVGQQATADYLGIWLSTFNRHLKNEKWKGDLKAIEVGLVSVIEDPKTFSPVKPLSADDRKKKQLEAQKKRRVLSKQKRAKYNREYYRKNRQKMLNFMKDYYKKNKEKICNYGKEYRKQIKEGERV